MVYECMYVYMYVSFVDMNVCMCGVCTGTTERARGFSRKSRTRGARRRSVAEDY